MKRESIVGHARRAIGFRRRLGIDARALATLRIALGLLLLGDIAMRIRDLEAFYTDAGVLPTEVLVETFPILATLSIHAQWGSAVAQKLLVAIAAVTAVALLVGYRTRFAAVFAWLLLVSQYTRNPYVLNGGDTILVVAFFVCLFLPLGARWSVDAVRASVSEDRTRVASVATATLLGFLVCIYASSAVLKFQSEWWTSGDAVRLVFELDQFTVLLGPALSEFDALLVAVNYVWMALLTVSVLLPVLTGRRRTLLVAAFVCVHLGMLSTMRLGLFPLVMVTLLLPFLPTPVWDRVEQTVARPITSQLAPLIARIESTTLAGVRRPSWPAPVDRLAVDDPTVDRWRRGLSSVVLSLVLLSVIGWQTAIVADLDGQIGGDAGLDPTEYGWAMFAPNPPEVDGWYVVSGELESGERVDAFRGGPVDWDRPPNVADAYPTALWHRYLTDLRSQPDRVQRAFGTYLCAQGSDRFDERLLEVTTYYVRQPVTPDGPGEPESLEVITVTCSEAT